MAIRLNSLLRPWRNDNERPPVGPKLVQALKQQNWVAVVLELLIVLSGVFFGIEAANWNAERQDDAEALRSMQQLQIEVAGVSEALGEEVSAQRSAGARRKEALQHLLDNDFEAAAPLVPSAVLTLFLRPSTEIEQATLDELLQLGIASNFPADVRRSFIEYTKAIEAYRGMEEVFRDVSFSLGEDAGQGTRKIVSTYDAGIRYAWEFAPERITDREEFHYHIAYVYNLGETRANFLEVVQQSAARLCAQLAIHTSEACAVDPD